MYIEELQEELIGRKLEIWQGINIEPDKAESFRQRWLARSRLPKVKPETDWSLAIRNFTNFLNSFVQQKKAGFPILKGEAYEKRIELCRVCPELEENWKCGLCGCHMKTKASWATQKCPIGKW